MKVEKNVLPVCLFLTAIMFGLVCFGQVKRTAQKPNIIYIYADDLGYGELGCYGQEKIKTPNLDRMAAEGLRFTQHYTSTPVCAPARAMLLTGRHGGHSFIRGNYEMGGFADEEEGGQMPLPEGTFTLGHLLQQAGYTTSLFGKWGLGMGNTSGSPLKQGFNYYYGILDQKQAHNFYPTHLWENDAWSALNNPPITVHRRLDSNAKAQDFAAFQGKDYSQERITEKAVSFIKEHQQKPFFMYMAYSLPHVSLQVPNEALRPYLGRFPEKAYLGQQGYAPHPYPLSAYAAMISYLDAQVGILLNQLKALGLDSNTLVMFSSDNGPTFNGGVNALFFNSTGGLRGLKMDLYEGGIRMPFIVRWPASVKPGRVSSHISAQYDIMATLADLTSQKIKNTDGISLLPTITGDTGRQRKHDFLYFEYPENGGQVAIRMGHWKGVRTQVRKNGRAPWQLYNLAADPAETTDVADKHADIVKAMETVQHREHWHATIREWEFLNPKFPVQK